MIPFDLSTLDLERDAHTDKLLELLSTVPDGYHTARADVWVGGKKEPGWHLEADGYYIGVQPDYKCGWDEEGDGKVLTALLTRQAETKGQVNLTTTAGFRDLGNGEHEFYVKWRAGVHLGSTTGLGDDSPRAGRPGLGWANDPGMALLLAYLRAWGVAK